jgi:hypothetical protein
MIEEKNTIEEVLINDNFDITNYYGYVYLTINVKNNRQYIGKKAFFLTQNKKLGKKEKANLPVNRGRKPSTKKIVTESDWKDYYGSSVEIKKTPKEYLKRYLIKLCKNKKELTYWEAKLLFQNEVLEDKSGKWINDNILAKFYRKDLESQNE